MKLHLVHFAFISDSMIFSGDILNHLGCFEHWW
jgi:hypothetical protein